MPVAVMDVVFLGVVFVPLFHGVHQEITTEIFALIWTNMAIKIKQKVADLFMEFC